MNDEHTDHLIDRHLDGGLTPEEAAELNALVLSSPEARQRFWELARFHATMREWGAEHWGHERAAEKVVPFPWRHVVRWSLAAAALAMACALWWQPWIARDVSEPSTLTQRMDEETGLAGDLVHGDTAAPASAPGVAVLTRTSDIAWAKGQPWRGPGQILTPGWLKIERGIAQVQFYSGARVLLEGPVEFEIISEMEARCVFGKFSAQVPEQAHGFRVITPGLTVVDLGTAFGCDVPREGLADVHVLEGRVALDQPGAARTEWNQGQAVRGGAGRVESILFSPDGFISPREFVTRADAAAQRRHAEWKQAVATLSADPATLIHYTFEEQAPWDSVLVNSAAQAAPGTSGSITGCALADGRWPGKGALEFKGAGDRVRLGTPGTHRALTYLAWVRVDSLPNEENSLLSAVQSGLGAADWMITDTGSLSFKVRAATGKANVHFYGGVSSAFVSPIERGRWMHLATVYDSDAGVIAHYLDGQLINKLLPKKVAPARLDSVELGNWGLSPNARKWWPRDRPVPLRNFVGRIDELAVLARAMTSEEIARHYAAGRP